VSGRRLRWFLTSAAAVALIAGFVATNLRISHRPATAKKDINSIVDKKVSGAVDSLQSQPATAAQVFGQVRAGLVLIEAAHTGGSKGDEDLGSGAIVNANGEILTALHVVSGGGAITVTFSDGTKSPATIKSSDADHDIAVLTPDQPPSVIVPETLGGGAQIGDDTFAVGNPLGLVHSITAGVISGIDRSFPLADGRTLSGMIQFDAAVNPGSSGGPLLNRKGQVIGIVTGLANPVGDKDFVGIGFAVPISTAGGAAGAPPR
jgi:S1-C subfamily serine protease